MSQVEDVRPAAMQPGRFHAMSDGDLADAHRGHTFALERAKGALAAIEAELERRGLTSARGKTTELVRRTNDGLLDLPRLRAEMGEAFCRRFIRPGTQHYWRPRTLSQAERGQAVAPGA